MKVQGKINDYLIAKEEKNRFLVNYDFKSINDTDATWYQLVFYKKQFGTPSFDTVKKAILEDINSRTDKRILSGFVWNGKPVYLSEENQKNFSEAQRVAQMTDGQNLPIKFKLGEDEEGNPVYHTFTALTALTDFYLRGVAYINQTLNEGWEEKDAIDWTPYQEALEPVVNVEQ